MVRRAQATVTTAQSLYGLAALTDPAARTAQHAADAQAGAAQVYSSVSLFNEHTWGAADPWTHGDVGMQSGEQQWHWKYGHALYGEHNSEVYLDHAASALGATLPAGTEADLSVWAVNTAPVARTATVRSFVRESRIPLDRPLTVVDARTGTKLDTVVEPQINPVHRDAGRWLSVEVPDVPPYGLVRLDVTAGAAEQTRAEAGELHISAAGGGPSGAVALPTEADVTLENEHLRVRVDLTRACVASLVEKATGRELVDQEAVVGFNGYVYDTYTTAGGYNHQSNKTASSPELELLGSRTLARPAVLLERVDDAVEQRLTFEYSADGVQTAQTTVRLGRNASHVEFDNRFDKPATMTKESAYLAFPFALTDPVVHYEITGALTGDGIEHVPGAPQHMRAIRSFVSLSDVDGPVAWVTRDAPLVEPATIPLPYAPFPDSTAPRQPGTVYSWVHNNIWDTNFPSSQAFDTTFRYAVGVRRAGEDIDADALALRTAYEIDRPLVGVVAQGGTAGGDPERSLLSLDDPRATVLDVTPVQGDGEVEILVRLQSYATEATTVRLWSAVPVASAQLATLLGDPTAPAEVAGEHVVVPVPRLGSVAVRLRLADKQH